MAWVWIAAFCTYQLSWSVAMLYHFDISNFVCPESIDKSYRGKMATRFSSEYSGMIDFFLFETMVYHEPESSNSSPWP